MKKNTVVEKKEEQEEEILDDDMDHFHDSELDDEESRPADEEDPFS